MKDRSRSTPPPPAGGHFECQSFGLSSSNKALNTSASNKRRLMTANHSMSSSSLNETGTYPHSHHKYHYIQYPPVYYHDHDRHLHQPQQTAMPQMASVANSCRCQCACGEQQHQRAPHPTRQHLTQRCYSASQQGSSADSQMSVAVIVHHQAGSNGLGGDGSQRSIKSKSEQSLLNHSYQDLQEPLTEKKPLNLGKNSKLNISCECDLECSCSAMADAEKRKLSDLVPDPMFAADEITVSESDNNSTMIKKKETHDKSEKFDTCCMHDPTIRLNQSCHSHQNSSHIDIYSEGDANIEGIDICLKDDNDSNDGDRRPPLPPRPPPRPRNLSTHTSATASHHHRTGIKKYVVWCLICGGFSCLLGLLHLLAYFLLHSYTITVGNFETVPTFVPATLLILTGLCIMSLARRRNRYSYLIKLSGACGLISALTCALVTVTTTVLHMSRLQALRECEYAQKTRTCTCYSDMIESQVDRVDKEGVRLVFDSLSDCGVVHGSLYSCLRAIFGLSVAGVLVAVFSCMLVYQLLSHERKKMYWEQLELRCRSLYTSQQGQPPSVSTMPGSRGVMCRCCEQCHHSHRQVPAYPWDDGGEPRFWTGQPPGNFYSPNPGGDDIHLHIGASSMCRGHSVQNTRSRMSGWSWPRMPWQRNLNEHSSRFAQTPSSPDSQYGFSNNGPNSDSIIVEEAAPVTVPVPVSAPAHNTQTYNVINSGSLPYGVWGPPPPYSDPNSPVRRGYYQYIQANAVHNNGSNRQNDCSHTVNTITTEQRLPQPCLNHRSVFLDQPSSSSCCTQTPNIRNTAKRQTTTVIAYGSNLKPKSDYENAPSDSDGGARFSNTLPTRKIKRRVDTGVKSIGPNTHAATRVSVQQIFPNVNCGVENVGNMRAVNDVSEYQESSNPNCLSEAANAALASSNAVRLSCKKITRAKRGVENNGFHNSIEGSGGGTGSGSGGGGGDSHAACDPTESEVYFADVSSCCNMSVKNDNYYEDTSPSNHHIQQQNIGCNHHSTHKEDYLAKRFGQRENSVRSRLPFPQLRNSVYEENGSKCSTSTPAVEVNNMPIQKEISRQSMCSVESEAKTEFTDLSPSTPCSNKFNQLHFGQAATKKSATELGEHATAIHHQPPHSPSFVASLPYSSESQSLEAHRRSTKNIHDLMQIAEGHYEVIQDNAHQYGASPQVRANKATQHRSTNLPSSRQRGEKSRTKAKSKDRLDVPAMGYPADMEWSEGGGGGGDQRL